MHTSNLHNGILKSTPNKAHPSLSEYNYNYITKVHDYNNYNWNLLPVPTLRQGRVSEAPTKSAKYSQLPTYLLNFLELLLQLASNVTFDLNVAIAISKCTCSVLDV